MKHTQLGCQIDHYGNVNEEYLGTRAQIKIAHFRSIVSITNHDAVRSLLLRQDPPKIAAYCPPKFHSLI
uniref:Uncharacterized protein n=1 Tax=Romanomermis culicivorax TaxID=13658 RepID=A0A915KMJ6_ROMCU